MVSFRMLVVWVATVPDTRSHLGIVSWLPSRSNCMVGTGFALDDILVMSPYGRVYPSMPFGVGILSVRSLWPSSKQQRIYIYFLLYYFNPYLSILLVMSSPLEAWSSLSFWSSLAGQLRLVVDSHSRH